MADVYVYIAGPLFGSGRSSANIHRVIQAAERIRAAGMTPFVPHLFHFWDTMIPHEERYWLDLDRAWLAKCDAMLRLDGASPGCTLEEQWCEELGIPVFHEGEGMYGIDELIEVYA